MELLGPCFSAKDARLGGPAWDRHTAGDGVTVNRDVGARLYYREILYVGKVVKLPSTVCKQERT